MIGHESFLNALFGLITAVDLLVMLKTKEIPRVMNYLPLAHMFGCGTIISITYLGKATASVVTEDNRA